MATLELDEAKARELEEKFDTEIRFRPLAPLAGRLVGTLLVILSLFHYYTAGFGLLPEMEHRGIHLSFAALLDDEEGVRARSRPRAVHERRAAEGDDGEEHGLNGRPLPLFRAPPREPRPGRCP